MARKSKRSGKVQSVKGVRRVGQAYEQKMKNLAQLATTVKSSAATVLLGAGRPSGLERAPRQGAKRASKLVQHLAPSQERNRGNRAKMSRKVGRQRKDVAGIIGVAGQRPRSTWRAVNRGKGITFNRRRRLGTPLFLLLLLAVAGGGFYAYKFHTLADVDLSRYLNPKVWYQSLAGDTAGREGQGVYAGSVDGSRRAKAAQRRHPQKSSVQRPSSRAAFKHPNRRQGDSATGREARKVRLKEAQKR